MSVSVSSVYGCSEGRLKVLAKKSKTGYLFPSSIQGCNSEEGVQFLAITFSNGSAVAAGGDGVSQQFLSLVGTKVKQIQFSWSPAGLQRMIVTTTPNCSQWFGRKDCDKGVGQETLIFSDSEQFVGFQVYNEKNRICGIAVMTTGSKVDATPSLSVAADSCISVSPIPKIKISPLPTAKLLLPSLVSSEPSSDLPPSIDSPRKKPAPSPPVSKNIATTANEKVSSAFRINTDAVSTPIVSSSDSTSSTETNKSSSCGNVDEKPVVEAPALMESVKESPQEESAEKKALQRPLPAVPKKLPPAVPPKPSTPPPTVSFPSGTFYIKNKISGLFLDAEKGSKKEGTKAIIWKLKEKSNKNQQWQFNSKEGTITNMRSNLVLEMNEFDVVITTKFAERLSQRWSWDGSTLTNKKSGVYMSILKNSAGSITLGKLSPDDLSTWDLISAVSLEDDN